jgi:hypothetical protein
MAKHLVGVELGGQRTYLSQLPAGLSISPLKQDWKTSGMDVLSGTSHKIEFAQITVYWHKDRAVSVMARAHGATQAALDEALHTISNLASLAFEFDPRSEQYRLPCHDQLLVRATKGQLNRNIPVLMLSIDHPSKGEMEKDLRGRK